MKTENEITTIVKKHGGKHLQFGNIPSWMDKVNQEGIELIGGKIRPFWYKELERVYNEPVSDQWQKVINEVTNTDKAKVDEPNQKEERPTEKTEKKKEQLPVTTETKETNNALIPEVLTIPLLDKWRKMTTFERMLMFQKTDKSNICERPGFGGKKVKYVEGNFMIQEANIAFLFSWSSKIEGFNIGDKSVSCYGSITVDIDGKQVTRAAVGVEELNSGVDAQHAMKNAATDMIKKGLSSLGFNGDVYRGEV
jgi:hypothetical protein